MRHMGRLRLATLTASMRVSCSLVWSRIADETIAGGASGETRAYPCFSREFENLMRVDRVVDYVDRLFRNPSYFGKVRGDSIRCSD